MPKPGFKSFSLNEEMYELLLSNFEKNKEKLRVQGISSFSGYLVSLLTKSNNENTLTKKDTMIFSVIYLKNNKLAIKDNLRNRVAELSIEKGKIFCYLDKRSDCNHVGFAYSLPEVYPLLEKSSNH